MAKKETASQTAPLLPMLKTVEQMSKVSGIGENKLRELMDSGELEYIQNGNRRLVPQGKEIGKAPDNTRGLKYGYIIKTSTE